MIRESTVEQQRLAELMREPLKNLMQIAGELGQIYPTPASIQRREKADAVPKQDIAGRLR